MDIKNLHQVGEKTSKILNKLGIFTDDDLINYYPYRYNLLIIPLESFNYVA